MADAIVGSLVKSLISLLQTEFSEIKDVKKDVAKLVSTLSTIQAVLEDAEEKQITSKPITYWLRRLKDASYDAEDVLEAWSLEIQQRELDSPNMGCSSIVSHSISSCFCFKSILFRRRIAKEIKEILSNFDEIAKQKSDFHLKNSGISQSRSHFSKERETSSIINKKKIVDILVTDFVNQENVSVCSIFDIGGLGKTTLAQSIYNDGSVQRHFENVKIWACVSDPFDLVRVLKSIVESFEKKACDLERLEAVRRRLFPLPPNLLELNISGYKWEPYFSEELFPQNFESLDFWNCDKIVSLPEGLLEHLTSLKSLHIGYCKGLKRLGIQGGGVNHPNTSSSSHLQSYPLREIHINNCPELVFSEEDFQQLNALEVLSLNDLPRLTVLPQEIQHLPMLRSLVIYNCSNLKMLPEWIKHLTALQSLLIANCHEELHKRCEKDKGEDWHLISHIPNFSIQVINW